jgi:dTDP-4-dehydrorhamnose reductase
VGAQIISILGPDRAVPASRAPAQPGWVQLDLASLAGDSRLAADRIAQLDVGAVYCVGGMTDVERCESEPEMAMRINCHGPAALAEAAARNGVPFVYFSTEYIFDGNSGPYTEDAPASPISVYGRSKWLGEQAILRAHSCPLIVRTTVVYGSDARGKNFLYALRRAMLERRTMRVANDQISTPTYNRDLARTTIALLQSRAHGVWNVCGPQRLSRLEFALRAARAMGLDESGIVGVPTAELRQAARRPLSAGLSTERLRRFPSLPAMRGTEEAIGEWVREGRFEVDG